MTFPVFKAGDSALRGSNGGFDFHTPPPYSPCVYAAISIIFSSSAVRRSPRDKLPAEIISILYSDVLGFTGGTSQKDDLTAIVIKRN